jgi:hypothetical protein
MIDLKNLNLEGRFHAHITIETTEVGFRPPKGWKTTIIILNKDNRIQQDIMVTRHFVVNSPIRTLKSIQEELSLATDILQEDGHKILRVKLEHESLPTVYPSESFYRECHIKIKKPIDIALITIPGFVQSKNPMIQDLLTETVFLNARYYSGSIEEIDKSINCAYGQISELNPNCKILEVKIESTVYDSNLELDKWWA